MKIIGQPESYSDILQRVFYCTLITSLVCVCFLSRYSPAFKSFLETLNLKADIGVVKGLKALYVLIPLAIAIVSRFIKLHDKISDLFLIRHGFDINHILLPIAKKVGYDLPSSISDEKRNNLMYIVFYHYAGFKDPIIDAQLVRTALDSWGWFWVGVEASLMLFITAIIFMCMSLWTQLLLFLLSSVIIVLICKVLYKSCVRYATAEVNAICNDENRRDEILRNFASERVES